MIACASEREIDLEMERKRKSEGMSSAEGSGKRPKVFDFRPRGQHGCSHCGKFDKAHEGACRVGGSGCFKCGQTGHIGKDYTVTTTAPVSGHICFHCNQRGHKRAQCSSLIATATGPVSAPAPTTLRITDGRQGWTEASAVKSMAFHLTA